MDNGGDNRDKMLAFYDVSVLHLRGSLLKQKTKNKRSPKTTQKQNQNAESGENGESRLLNYK